MLGRVRRGVCDHKCTVLPLYRQVFLVGSSLLYCADIFTDIYVAIDTLVNGKEVKYIGSCMLFFVVVPLIYGNYITQANRFGRVRYLSAVQTAVVQTGVFVLDKDRIKGRPFLRTLAPYPWNSPQHVLFNVLCLLQLGILIDVIEMLTHRKQEIRGIAQQYSHYCYIRRLEVMLENCPQLLLQVCALVKDNTVLLLLDGDVSTSDVIRLSSLFLTVVSLPLALCADEEAGRYCSRVNYDLVREVKLCKVITIPVQLAVLYLGYLLMIISRIALVALLYVFCKKADIQLKPLKDGPNLITPLCVEAHHLTILIIYLINQRRAETNKSLVIIEKLRRLNMAVSFYFFSFSEVFIILLQFPQRYRRAIRSLTKEKDKGDERFKSFYLLYAFNLAEFILVAIVCSSWSKEDTGLDKEVISRGNMMVVAYFSIACYLLSGVFFMFYHTPLLHPDSLRQRASYKNNPGFRMHGKIPHCGAKTGKIIAEVEMQEDGALVDLNHLIRITGNQFPHRLFRGENEEGLV